MLIIELVDFYLKIDYNRNIMKIGFFGLLTLLFATAKIFNYVDWSWWLVFTPSIVGLVLFIFIVVIAAYAGVEIKK
jgi:membrane glycosyltransferase